MTPIEEITYIAVKEIQDKCIAEHRAPVNASLHAIQRDVMEKVKSALNSFVQNGTMEWHNNVNGVPMFTIVKPIQK